MVNSPDLPRFERCALASGLLTQEQIDEALAALRWTSHGEPTPDSPRNDRQLADKLVELGRLNSWQAGQLLEGQTKFNLGPYWIVDSLGQGGMGQVFKAEHGVMKRVVAVKVLPRSKCTPEAIASFTREIRALARLDHPCLVRALDAGQDGNVYYLVTEYVAGIDLRKLVRRDGPLSMQAAARIISQVAEGLQHAHEQGLIHRDVKPGNILVATDGRAKVLDLGLSGSLKGDAEDDPRYGKIVGTADYLSPDHIKFPMDPKPAWDIYSLGCTLYYAVTGKVPFPGGTIREKARAHCELRPLDPRRLTPILTAEFVDVIADMMAKDPAERIATACEVMVRLAPWLNADPPVSPPQQTGSRKGRRSRAKDGASGKPHTPVAPPLADLDTKASFPEMPELQGEAKEASSQLSQATHSMASVSDETSSAVELQLQGPSSRMILISPVMFLIVLPLGLVVLVMLIYYLALMFIS